MGKWEINIGNVIKNNSGGRVVIEENGVRYNKKVSVVLQVVNGTVKQVWNAYSFPGIANMFVNGNVQIATASEYSEAKSFGATKIEYKFTIVNNGGDMSRHPYSNPTYDALLQVDGHSSTDSYNFFRQSLTTSNDYSVTQTYEGTANITAGSWADKQATLNGVYAHFSIGDNKGYGDGTGSCYVEYIRMAK